MRAWGAWVVGWVVAVVATGCTSTRVMQRDGCWVRQTEKFPKRVTEEMGPCSRPEPKWAEDRISRVVQECMAQADYRWQNRALAAWNRGEPLPPQESDQQTMAECMKQAEVITEHDALKDRLAELSHERDSLRATVAQDRSYIRESHDKMALALGEAAKKPAPAAVATATSNGSATTQSDLKAQQPGYALAATPVAPAGMCSMPEPVKAPRPRASTATSSKPEPQTRASGAPACDPKAAPEGEKQLPAQDSKVAVVAPAPGAAATVPPAGPATPVTPAAPAK